jgi:hypothetical protein
MFLITQATTWIILKTASCVAWHGESRTFAFVEWSLEVEEEKKGDRDEKNRKKSNEKRGADDSKWTYVIIGLERSFELQEAEASKISS